MAATIVDMHVRLNGSTNQHLEDLMDEKRKQKNTTLRSVVSKNSVINECINLRHQEIFNEKKEEN